MVVKVFPETRESGEPVKSRARLPATRAGKRAGASNLSPALSSSQPWGGREVIQPCERDATGYFPADRETRDRFRCFGSQATVPMVKTTASSLSEVLRSLACFQISDEAKGRLLRAGREATTHTEAESSGLASRCRRMANFVGPGPWEYKARAERSSRRGPRTQGRRRKGTAGGTPLPRSPARRAPSVSQGQGPV